MNYDAGHWKENRPNKYQLLAIVFGSLSACLLLILFAQPDIPVRTWIVNAWPHVVPILASAWFIVPASILVYLTIALIISARVRVHYIETNQLKELGTEFVFGFLWPLGVPMSLLGLFVFITLFFPIRLFIQIVWKLAGGTPPSMFNPDEFNPEEKQEQEQKENADDACIVPNKTCGDCRHGNGLQGNKRFCTYGDRTRREIKLHYTACDYFNDVNDPYIAMVWDPNIVAALRRNGCNI